jgi:hypothetical protein
MVSDSSKTTLRCGYDYFIQPPLERVQERMDNYPEINEFATCEHWTEHAPTILAPSEVTKK